MKKLMLIFFVCFIAISVNAQFSHTKWTGAIKGDNPRDAVLKFGKDTLVLSAASDGSVIETMTYLVKENVLTVTKISGQSDCAVYSIGKYKFELKESALNISILADDCEDRSSALDKTGWVKKK